MTPEGFYESVRPSVHAAEAAILFLPGGHDRRLLSQLRDPSLSARCAACRF